MRRQQPIKTKVEPTPSRSLPPLEMLPPIQVPELVGIPAGVFIMGDDYGPREARPAHELMLPDYFISRYPVTALEFARFIVDQRSSIPLPGIWPGITRWMEQGDQPVAAVRWRDAMDYCGWLGRQIGRVVRLPNEAEWEKAATWDDEQGQKRIYPWGNEFDPAYANTAESLNGRLTSVTEYRVTGDSSYGVSDMFGNAAEWTIARYLPYPYSNANGRHDLNLMGYRAVRGGSFQSEGKWVNAINRQFFAPDENRYPVGFRVVVEAKSESKFNQ